MLEVQPALLTGYLTSMPAPSPHRSVRHFLEHVAAVQPDRIGLLFGDQAFSYGCLDRLAGRLAGALRTGGLCSRDRVLIHLGNSVEAVISMFGVLRAGGCFALVHPEVKAAKLRFLIDDAGASVLITQRVDPSLTDGSCKPLRWVLETAHRTAPSSRVPRQGFLDALTPRPDSPAGVPKADEFDHHLDGNELCCLVYTSGSTGYPKGVALTHENVLQATASISQYLQLRATDRIAGFSPLSCDYGLYNVLLAFRNRATLRLERAFLYPFQLIGLVEQQHITGLPLVPTSIAILLRFQHRGTYRLPSLRYITSTGQALPPSHIEQLRQRLPRVQLYSMYGLTECKRVSYLPPTELGRRPASVGKAMPGTEAFPVDRDGRAIHQRGRIGELVVRGPHVMQSYWRRPRATSLALRPDPEGTPGSRRLHSGDLFRLDAEGFLYFVSRRDDMLKIGGELVSPKEVENALFQLEAVAEAVVFGVDDPILGQALAARLVLADGARLHVQQVREHCTTVLEKFMVPRDIEFIASLPRTSTGKTHRRQAREQALSPPALTSTQASAEPTESAEASP